MIAGEYALGCPLWGQKNWLGHFYSADAKPGGYLEQYSSVFNAVEGNTTFYAEPAPATVARWARQVPADFRFCFKLPQAITHERRLRECDALLRAFLDLLEPLGERLGPFLIQLPASFGPDQSQVLHRFLGALPGSRRYALELRHPGYFDAGVRGELETMLARLRIDNVILDARPMRSGDLAHPDVLAAAHRKPDLPVFPAVTAGRPFLRLVFHPDEAVNGAWIEHWVRRVAGWIAEGHRPYVFVHCPNNLHSPGIARAFHRGLLSANVVRQDMPAWPAQEESLRRRQRDLF